MSDCVWVAEYETCDGAELLSVHTTFNGAKASCADHADVGLLWKFEGHRHVADITDLVGYVVRQLVLRD